MGKDFGPENTDAVRKAVLILGDSGVGKTSIAATSEDPYILDVEGRAEKAHAPRYVPDQDERGWKDLVDFIQEVKTSKRMESGLGLIIRGHPTKTFILDTIDRAQELFRMANKQLLAGSNKQKFYGAMLDAMLADVVFPIMALPMNIIIVSHSAEKSLDAIEQKATPQAAPETTLALEGQIRRRLPNYFDNAFHMVRKQDGSTIILTTATTYEGRFLYAKDKAWLFGGKQIPVKWVDGKIESDAMRKVFTEMHSASEKKVLVDRIKIALRDYAIELHIMKDAQDKTGAKLLTENVMPQLKEKLDIVTVDTAEAIITEGKELENKLLEELQK